MWIGEEQQGFFEQILWESTGQHLDIIDVQLVSGGSINTSVRILTEHGAFFAKFNHAEREDQFEKEVRGLRLLQQTEAVAVANVLGFGKVDGKAYLLQNFIASGQRVADFWEDFGQSLALLHSHTQAKFGLQFDNYVGALPQNNQPLDNGIAFLVTRRLRPQAGLALYNELIDNELYRKLEKFYELLPQLLPNERPALLHGDLWSGNFLTNEQGRVALIDPAPYYGFREAEIAFTHLFGGFEAAFYESYHDTFPLEDHFEERIAIYNLYPLLVHVNLFGKSYLAPIDKLLKKYF
jgi:protein-ribulosamine 3-kinase